VPRDPATHVGIVVLIDGAEVPCDPVTPGPGILSGLAVVWGRDNRLDTPGASTCTFQMIDTSGTSAHLDLVAYDSTVEVLDVAPDGTRARVFIGHVSDLGYLHDEADAVLSVTAIDPTASLSAISMGDTPWPRQTLTQRRDSMEGAIPAGAAEIINPPLAPNIYMQAPLDVDNRTATDVITEYYLGLAHIPYPATVSGTTTPSWVAAGPSSDGAYGVRDAVRDNQRDCLALLRSDESALEFMTVIVDACDIDLDGTEFRSNPTDSRQSVRLTYGPTSDQRSVFYKVAGASRTLEVSSGLDIYSSGDPGYSARNIAEDWAHHMPDWPRDFDAPWAVGELRIDPDTVTAMDEFHRAVLVLLDGEFSAGVSGRQGRTHHRIMLQNLPDWTPWHRGTRADQYGEPGDHCPNVVGLLLGGTYTFEDGRWVLSLRVSIERALQSELAPPLVVVVRPGDVVRFAHDDTTVDLVADPDTTWPVGAYATFADGRYGWDGTAWVYGGVRPVYVSPGDTSALAHTDLRVRPEPTTPWAAGDYATFADGAYRWDGSGWAAMVFVRPGDTPGLAHTNPAVAAEPTTAWAADDYATFTDGDYRWDGSGWVSLVVSVSPGSTVDRPHDDPAVTPSPTTPWAADDYATFADGTYRWDGSAWTAVAVVRPGDTVDVAHDDPAVIPEPTTAWAATEWATFADGAYRWDGSAWAAVLVVEPYDTVDVAHTDPSVIPEPSGYWFMPGTGSSRYSFATFSDGTWAWASTAWQVAYVIRPGDTATNRYSSDPRVTPWPYDPWTAGQWARLSDGTFAWSGTAWVPAEVVPIGPGDTSPLNHDDPSVVPEPTTPWAEDDYATFADGTYRWDGSAWVAYEPPAARENLATNPHVASADGWTYAGQTFTVETGTDTPDGRPGFLRGTIVTPDAGGFAGPMYDVAASGGAGEVLTYSVAVRPSVEWTFRASASTRTNLTVNSTQGPDVLCPAGQWTRLEVAVPTTGAYTGLRLIVQETAAGPAAGVTIDVTQVIIERDTSGAYFDGDTPDADGWTYAWTGAPGASTSTADPGAPSDTTWSGAPEGTAWQDVPTGTAWSEWTGEV
jgi:hypothetical protein